MNREVCTSCLRRRGEASVRRGATLLALMVLVSALSGCGGGGKSTSTTTTPSERIANKTVTIQNGAVVERKLALDRNASESVRWSTSDDHGYTIAFVAEGWPFEQPPQLIYVDAQHPSPVFNVIPSTDKGPYTYRVYTLGQAPSAGGLPPGKLSDPPPTGPTDPPAMDVGP